MNTDEFKGKWEQLKGSLKETWGDLSDQDLDKMKGGFQEAVGYLQEKYGEAKETIEQKLSSLMDKFKSNEDKDNVEDYGSRAE
ncbi:MAG: CsbD family protein [Alphaproteobacteria bacterium]|nr:CsbD family protein [Alphaproteobacteria bacterium]